MSDYRFEGKTVVVTGASSGIGRAIAKAYAGAGARVVINYCHSRDKAQQLLDEIRADNGQAFALQADVAKTDEIDGLLKSCLKEFGEVDVWVNNAGADILTGSGADLSDTDKLQRLIEVDLKGTINACWLVAPRMKSNGQGVIINMSWDLARHGFEGTNPQIFSAAKAGVLGFSRSLALSYAPEVRVNVLAPGWIETAFAAEDMDDEYYQARIKEIPLARFGKPEDVANVALYLGSDDAAYVTGEVININGGLI